MFDSVRVFIVATNSEDNSLLYCIAKENTTNNNNNNNTKIDAYYNIIIIQSYNIKQKTTKQGNYNENKSK